MGVRMKTVKKVSPVNYIVRDVNGNEYQFETLLDAMVSLGALCGINEIEKVFSKKWYNTIRKFFYQNVAFSNEFLFRLSVESSYVERVFGEHYKTRLINHVYKVDYFFSSNTDFVTKIDEKIEKLFPYKPYNFFCFKRKSGTMYKHPKTLNEKKQYATLEESDKELKKEYGVNIKGRKNRRSPRMLPDTYDDISKSCYDDKRNWKNYRKTQYKTT
jgi:hypothetical protein